MPSVLKTVLFSLAVTAGVQAAPMGLDEIQQPSENSSIVIKFPDIWDRKAEYKAQMEAAEKSPGPVLVPNGLLPLLVIPQLRPLITKPPYHYENSFHPEPLEESAGEAAINVQPVLDYDTDSCYNIAAVDENGTISQGLPKDGHNAEGCRDPADLNRQNVYSRSRCNHGWCAHMYEHFFEKDVAIDWLPVWGHTYDWENIVVVTKRGTDKAELVCVSQHGEYECKKARDVRFEGTHPKVIYHKDGPFTHCFRFAREKDEQLENAKGQWIRGALIDWHMWPDNNVRDSMVEYFRSEFSTVRPKLSDTDFTTHLESAIQDRCLSFNFGKDG